MKRLRIFLLCFTAIALLCPTVSLAQNKELRREAKETLILDLEEYKGERTGGPILPWSREGIYVSIGSIIENMKISPNLRHVALVVEEGGKMFVVYDSITHERYDLIFHNRLGIGGGRTIDSLSFSPDGDRFAYTARTGVDSGAKFYKVIDGKSYGPYDMVSPEVFSQDGEHVAFGAQVGDQFFLVKDLVEEKNQVFDSLPMFISYSPDSSRMTFLGSSDGEKHMFVDGVLGPAFEKFTEVTFSPDSQHYTYTGIVGDTWFPVIDGVRGPGLGFFGNATYSPDSKHLCYRLERDEKWYMVEDDSEGKAYQAVSYEKWYSPDSRRLAYIAWKEGKTFMVIDGIEKRQKGNPFTEFAFFSPDSKRFAYLEREKKGKDYVIVDDKAYGPYYGVGIVHFNSESTSWAFLAQVKKNKMLVVRDGVEGKTYQWVGNLLFSPDGKHFVYGAHDKKNGYAVLDGEDIPAGKKADSFLFSPDNKHLAYVVTEKDEKQKVVVNGAMGKIYDSIFKLLVSKEQNQKSLIFDSDDSLHYLAINDGKIYLVEESLK